MICVDSNGGAARLMIEGETKQTQAPIDVHVRSIAERYWYECVELGKDPSDHPIVFIIHGGLVGMGDSVAEAEAALAAMRPKGQKPKCFPIFVNWETGMRASYLNHLFLIREGREESLWYTIPTSPFVLLTDLGRAITRMIPVLLTTQRRNIFASYVDDQPQAVPGGWQESAWIDTANQARGRWETLRDVGQEFVPGLMRLVTTPMLDTIGVSAYRNMQRRARVLLLRDDDFAAGEHRLTGALAQLMRYLLERSDFRRESVRDLQRKLEVELAAVKDGAERKWIEGKIKVAARILGSNEFGHRSLPFANVGEPTFEILAHSMGAHVANGLVRRYGRSATFSNIVFMGAACSIREFADQTLPYIVANAQCRFFNLCLHPLDEIGEWSYAGTMPHGSLLVWIDSYITEHRTQMDYTLGQWNNVMRALPVIEHLTSDVRRRIKIRGFGRYGRYPRSHGQLNDVDKDYWKPTYWDPMLDPRTRHRANRQVANYRGQVSERAAEFDARLKVMQSGFDRSLAVAQTEAEVDQVHQAFLQRLEREATSAETAGVELDLKPLKMFWEQQVAARKDDLELVNEPPSGHGCASRVGTR